MFTHLTGPVRIFTALALLASSTVLADEDFSRTLSADPKGQVEVSTFGGVVDISGWDQSQVDIKGELSSSVERVDVAGDGHRTSIRVIMRNGGEATLKIRVPKYSEMEVTAVSADIHTHGVLGEQRLKTVSGDIYAELNASDVETKTVSGNTSLRGDRKPISLRATSVSGDIHYERGAGDLEGSTVSGSLSASLEPGKDVRVRTTSGDVTLDGKLSNAASLAAETISGELQMQMKTEGGYRYEINSFSGDIENCFNKEAERSSRYGPGSRLLGSLGEGKGEVRLKTMSGDINICDR
jgi:DUF4097 and DUF4098 domain-containing protein YvlB